MSYLTSLMGMYCPSDYYDEPYVSPEEMAARKKAQDELEERKKRTIICVQHFMTMARKESSGDGALGVKVLRDTAGLIHFMDTNSWPFHYQYCVSFLNEKRTLETFNEQVYTGKDRSMMFGTIVAYPKFDADSKTYCVELNPADPIVPDLEKIDEFLAQIKRAFMVDEKKDLRLYFHPTSATQIEATRAKQLCLPIIQSSEIFGDIPYKVGLAGEVKCKLLAVFNKEHYTQEELQSWLNVRSPEEIVVIPSVPNDIPAVGGVICKEFIPPLCHVALLCQNRNTPYCYYNYRNEQFNKVRGMFVDVVIASVGFYVDGTKKYTEAKSEPVEAISVQAVDTATTQFIELGSIKGSDARVVGAKASQLARVGAIYHQPIFEGTFVVPFHYYDQHSKSHQMIGNHVDQFLGKLESVTRTSSRSLAAIKSNAFDYNTFSTIVEKIIEVPVDLKLVQAVIDKIVQNNWSSVILRSSTNAEDLAGFNGAGLYESVPLLGDDVTNPEKIAHALKTVWASVWSPKAVKERQYYKIKHREVQMAVIVQPLINDTAHLNVILNGVCITHDVSRHTVKHGFVVHTFPGSEYKVTNHYKDATPESLTLLLGRQKDSVDMHLNALCNKSKGALLTQADASKIVEVFGKLHNMMLGAQHSMHNTVALDIEFMIVDNKETANERELVVLQARPYQVKVTPSTSNNYDYCVRSREYLSSFDSWSVRFTYAKYVPKF